MFRFKIFSTYVKLNMFIILCACNPDRPFSITPLNSSEVIFEQIGTVHFYVEIQKVFTEIQLDTISDDLITLQEYIHQINGLCKQFTNPLNKENCIRYSDEANNIVENIEQINFDIYHLNRHKRTVANFELNGGSLNDLHTVNESTLDIIHDSIQPKEVHLFEDSILPEMTTVKSEGHEITQIPLEVTLLPPVEEMPSLEEVPTTNDNHEAISTLNELMSTINLKITNIFNKQSTSKAILTTLNAGKIPLNLLSNEELSKVVNSLSTSLGITTSAIVNSDIIKVSSQQLNDKILIEMDVPQPEGMEFKLYRAYAIPKPIRNNIFSVLIVNEKFLAVSSDSAQYLLLTEREIDKFCINVNITSDQQQLICHQTTPVYTSANENCMVSLFKRIPVKAENCEHRIGPGKDFIVKLYATRSWLLLFRQNRTLSIKCNEGQFQETLCIPKQCILQVRGSACTIEFETFKLPSEKLSEKIITLVTPLKKSIKLQFSSKVDLRRSNNEIHQVMTQQDQKPIFTTPKHETIENTVDQDIGRSYDDQDIDFQLKKAEEDFRKIAIAQTRITVIVAGSIAMFVLAVVIIAGFMVLKKKGEQLNKPRRRITKSQLTQTHVQTLPPIYNRTLDYLKLSNPGTPTNLRHLNNGTNNFEDANQVAIQDLEDNDSKYY